MADAEDHISRRHQAAEARERDALHTRYAYAMDWLETHYTALDHWRRVVIHVEQLIHVLRHEEYGQHMHGVPEDLSTTHTSKNKLPLGMLRRWRHCLVNWWTYGIWTACHHPSWVPHEVAHWECLLCDAIDFERRE